MGRVSWILLIIFGFVCASCSRTYEPRSRAEKEKVFVELFGFSPPLEITNIQYRDVYNRHAIDGAWGRYMCLNFDPQVYTNIIQQRGFKLEQYFGKLGSGAEPSWWISTNLGITVYVRSQEDTVEEEGYFFTEYVWHDTNSSQIFYHKYYAD